MQNDKHQISRQHSKNANHIITNAGNQDKRQHCL